VVTSTTENARGLLVSLGARPVAIGEPSTPGADEAEFAPVSPPFAVVESCAAPCSSPLSAHPQVNSTVHSNRTNPGLELLTIHLPAKILSFIGFFDDKSMLTSGASDNHAPRERSVGPCTPSRAHACEGAALLKIEA
jgi:hypothetical protein